MWRPVPWPEPHRHVPIWRRSSNLSGSEGVRGGERHRENRGIHGAAQWRDLVAHTIACRTPHPIMSSRPQRNGANGGMRGAAEWRDLVARMPTPPLRSSFLSPLSSPLAHIPRHHAFLSLRPIHGPCLFAAFLISSFLTATGVRPYPHAGSPPRKNPGTSTTCTTCAKCPQTARSRQTPLPSRNNCLRVDHPCPLVSTLFSYLFPLLNSQQPGLRQHRADALPLPRR